MQQVWKYLLKEIYPSEEGYLSGRRERGVYKNKMEQIWEMFNRNKKVS